MEIGIDRYTLLLLLLLSRFSRVRLWATLCDPRDGSPPGSPVPGILQARTLDWVAISFSNAGKGKVKVKSLSRVRLLAIPWTAAYQAPPSMGFSRQEYWSGVPLPSPYPLFFVFLSHSGQHRALGRVTCTIQQVLIIYFIHSSAYKGLSYFVSKNK